MTKLITAAVFGVCLVGTVSLAADWPQFRGPRADGFSPETAINKDWNASQPKERWRVAMSDGGYSGPAVAGGHVFIIDHRGKQDLVRCISLADGKDVWTCAYDDASKANYGFSHATPTISDGKVYTVSREGRVHCLDARTGKVIWLVNMPAELSGQAGGWGYAASVLLDGDKAIVSPGGKGSLIAALDRNTGKLLWKNGSDQAGYATPVLATFNGIRQYLVFSATSLNGFAADDGKLLWTLPWKTAYDINAAAPLPLDNAVFISSGYGVGCAVIDIKPTGPAERFKNKVFQQHFSSAVLHEGMIYGTTDPGDLVCLNPRTGKETWRHKGFEKGGVAGVDGVLLALDGKAGDLVMVSLAPDAYKELGRIKPLGGQSWTAPIIADGAVLVRNTKELACFDISRK